MDSLLLLGTGHEWGLEEFLIPAQFGDQDVGSL